MTKAFSVAFKQKMIQRLTGKDAVSARQLAGETGVAQQNLSRWLEEARRLPIMAHEPAVAVATRSRCQPASARVTSLGMQTSVILSRWGCL
jgi:transposase-like protein